MNSLSIDHFSSQLPKIGRLLNILLILLLAVSAANIVWKWIEWRRFEPQIIAPETSKVAAARPAPYIDYGQQVARLHLFGSAVVSAPVVNQQVSESRLPLLLKGVFASNKDEQSGYAIIQEQGKPQKFYKVGDEISRGVSLQSVYDDYVLVERAGTLEKISLPRATLNAAPLDPSIDLGEDDSRQNEDTSLSGIRDELLRSPTKLTQLISIVPYSEDDQFIGFQVMPSQDPGLFQELGFLEGDVVTTINGITLDNPNKSIDAIEELMEASDINLTILRDGSTISLVRSLE